MGADILIVGQGLAGTLLAWECERAGLSFAIGDEDHGAAASRIAAGIVTPITGRRLVKSWQIDVLLPRARAAYREIEMALGVSLWHDVRVRRLFADEKERNVAAAKHLRGEFAPYVPAPPDAEGLWIEGAGRLDIPMLLDAARAHWRAAGRWHQEVSRDIGNHAGKFALVVDCRGAAGARDGAFGFIPWEFSKGQILALAVDGLAADVVLNRGHWVMPIAPGAAWVGATHEPHFAEMAPDLAGRKQLEESAAKLLGGTFLVTGHFAGVRVNLPDKRPVAGRHPVHQRLGLVNGLGAKGVLWAPALARQWINHLTEGVPFDEAVAAGRFWRKEISQT